MRKRQTLLIEYQSFKARKADKITVYPYLLKEYRNRWFLICEKASNRSPQVNIFALDRIRSVEIDRKHPFRKCVDFDPDHNYISDDNIIRKGAISAAEVERCIIPLNVRDGSLLCIGKGNPDWNRSAPHGAGRVMSRSQAYQTITMTDFEASMRDVYSESINDFTRDESPMVYKPADEIIANIGDTVRIDSIIRPIFNFKAS